MAVSDRKATRRYERKFRITDLTSHEVESLVQLHPALFRTLYPARFVNNVYFDSPGGMSYRDNVEGSMHRVKVRIRWYGELRGRVERPVLELKLKHGLIGEKESHVLPPFELGEAFRAEHARRILRDAELPVHVSNLLRSVRPVLLNRYRRSYYRSADGEFRLTLDTDLRFHRARLAGLALARKGVLDRATILELKYAREAEARADAITSAFPFRMTKNSKFVNGLEAIPK